MTDTYSTPSPETSANIVQMRVRQQRDSIRQAVSDINPDTDPDQAARAVQLGEATGTPASIVNLDVDEHALQMRRQATFQILLRNASLRAWVDSDPMASKIAADDWHNLDDFTKKLEKATWLGSWGRAEARVSHQFVSAFSQSFQNVPNRSAELLDLPSSIADMVPEEYKGTARELWSGSVGGAAYWPARGVELGLELLFRGIGGTIAGGIKASEQVLKEFGVEDSTASRIAKEAHGFAEFAMAAPLHLAGTGATGAGVRARHAELTRPVSAEEIRAAQHIQAAILAKPFVEAGEPVPMGLHPIWDKILADQAKYDRELLDGIEQSADHSGVRERSPEKFANLTKLVKELEVEIHPEAALRLYGDKPAGPGDGLLGDRAPNIAKQLADALEHEEKIKLPLEQYLLVDKEIRDALKDDVVSRKGGLTINEAKDIPEPPMDFKPLSQLYPDNTEAGKFRDALNAHRKATKSDPLFVREAQELHLQPRPDLPQPHIEGMHGFNVVDETGRQVAELQLTPSKDGKDLKIDWLGGTVTPTARPSQISNIFGPKLIRGLFQQIRDAFPEAETISGRRVSGAREGRPEIAQDVKIDIEALRQEFPESMADLPGHAYTRGEYEKFWDVAHSGDWTRFNQYTKAQIVRTPEMSAKEAVLNDEITNILRRIAPGIEVVAARELRVSGQPAQGVFQLFQDKAPLIIWSLKALDPKATARHEAIHWLRTYNIITPKEWAVLENAALEGKWIEKHKVGEAYKGEPINVQIEEAVAHEFGEWGVKRAKDHAASGIFSKMMQVVTRVKNAVTRAFGREVTAEELFQNIESGAVGRRGPSEPSAPREGQPAPFDMTSAEEGAPYQVAGPMMAKFPKQLELPIRRAEEMPPLEPGAIMPAARQEQYLRKWDEQRAAEQNAIDNIVERQTRLREDKRWKDRSVELLKDVEEKIRQQPEFLISSFFRRGVFYGDKVKDFMPKFDPKYLTPEQKASIPKAWLKKDGFAPDEVAPLFNITSGDEMLVRIAEFERLKGDLQPNQFFDLMVGKELERQLEAEFGKKEDVIMQEVRDHQFGGRNWDLYHEDTMAMAMQAKQEPPLSKGEFRAGVQQSFGEKLMKHVSWPAIERMMYSAGSKLEDAILGGDFAKAYRYAQAKEKAHIFGMEIKGLVSDLKNFNKISSKYGKREPTNVDPETTNFVHEIMNRIGETTRRSDADIATEIQAGVYKDLRSFVDARRADGFDVHMPEFLYDRSWSKSVEEMTVEEFRAVHEALKSMDAMSRTIKTTEVAGVTWEHDALIDRMVDTLKELPTKAEEIRLDLPEGPMKDLLKRAWASSIQLEAMFNRFDQGNPLGIFNQAIVRKYATAANYQAAADKRFGRILAEIESKYPIKQPNKVVFQELFKDPTTGEPLKFSRMNILALLANVGNPGNFYGMLDGWKIPREKANLVMDLIRNNTFREDWLRQQELGSKIWDVLKEENDRMRRELSGVAPTKVETWDQITGPRGEKFKGWYFPIIYDKRFPQKNPEMAGKSLTEYPYWAKQLLPGAPHAKQRTGYVGPYLLEFDSFAGRMQTMVRDTVWRPVLIDLQKIFRDDRFKAALSRHYGKQYTALLEPFLQDIAGNQKLVDENAAAGMKAIQFLRQNVISHLVGFNPYTIAKHDLTALIQSITEVGAKDFGKAFLSMMLDHDANSLGSMGFAMAKSEELQRRRKNYYENISGSFDRTFGDLMFSRELKDTFDTFKERPVGEAARIVKGEMIARYMRFRDTLHYIEAAPLATLDLWSAVPTWTAKYRAAIVEGHNEGQAMFLADRAVRRAHGSTVITNRPSVMRTNPFVASFVSFYAFFNHILMRQYEAAWAARAALHGEGYFVREPTVDRNTMETEPILIQRGRKDMAEVRAEEYKKTDAYKSGRYLIMPLAGMLTSYFIVPAWIEEIVSPQTTPSEAKQAKRGWGPIEGPKKDQMWLSYIAKAELSGLSGSWLGARDIVHAALHGGDVGAGVLGEGSREILKLVSQGKKGWPKTLEEKQKLLRSTNGLFNILTGGLAPNSVPRAGVFGYNWYTGHEKPKGFRDFWHGIGHGTLKEH